MDRSYKWLVLLVIFSGSEMLTPIARAVTVVESASLPGVVA